MKAAKGNCWWHFPPAGGFLSGAQSGGSANGGARLWQDPSFTQPRIHRTNSHNCCPCPPNHQQREIQWAQFEKYNWYNWRNTIDKLHSAEDTPHQLTQLNHQQSKIQWMQFEKYDWYNWRNTITVALCLFNFICLWVFFVVLRHQDQSFV